MSLCRGVGGSKKLLTPLRNVEMVPKEIIVQVVNCNYELITQEFCLTHWLYFRKLVSKTRGDWFQAFPPQMKGLYVGSLKKAKLCIGAIWYLSTK